MQYSRSLKYESGHITGWDKDFYIRTSGGSVAFCETEEVVIVPQGCIFLWEDPWADPEYTPEDYDTRIYQQLEYAPMSILEHGTAIGHDEVAYVRTLDGSGGHFIRNQNGIAVGFCSIKLK